MNLKLFSELPSPLHIFWAGAILAATVGLGVLFYFVVRRYMHRLAARTNTELDNMVFKAVEWPILVGASLLGLYLAVLWLPFVQDIDFEVRRGFHAAFIVFGAWTIIAVMDAIYRWYKLEIAPKTHTALDDWIASLLRFMTPVVLAVVAAVLCLEIYEISTEPVGEWLAAHGARIALVMVLAVVGVFALGVTGSRAISRVVARNSAGQPEEEVEKRVDTLSRVLITGGQVFIVVVAAFVIISETKLNISPILAAMSVVGVALGFGAQSLVKDMIAGFFIVMENQYRVGDVVSIAGANGIVVEINLRRTVLRDLDGTVHIVPNGEIRVASNMTHGWSRVNLDISVPYDTDLDKAIAVINRVCKQIAEDPQWSPMIVKTPEVLRVEKLGESGVDLKVLGDTKTSQQWAVAGEIRKRVKRAFDIEGIEIPYPHTTVLFGNAPPAPPAQ